MAEGKRLRLGFLRLLTVILVLASSARGEQVRVATFNLRNYLSTDRLVEGVYRMDYPKPEKEKEALYAVVRAVNPTILAVQEMGEKPYLLELQRDLRSLGVNYPHTVLLRAVDPDRHVAILSKQPFQSVKRHDDLAFAYFGATDRVKRGLLEVEFRNGDTEWTLFNLHLKSRRTVRKDDPESRIRREKEARTIRNFIVKRFSEESDRDFIVLGDFNDTRGSAPIRRFLSVGSRTITEMIPASDRRGEVWTYYYRKEDTYTRVDFLLASPSMLPKVRGDRGRVVDLPEGNVASDHRMVFIDLDFSRP